MCFVVYVERLTAEKSFTHKKSTSDLHKSISYVNMYTTKNYRKQLIIQLIYGPKKNKTMTRADMPVRLL